jgi:hypothetical protein
MDGTILGQGTFTANPIPSAAGGPLRTYSQPVTIQVPSGVDWISVRNYSQYGTNGVTTANFQGTANASIGSEFYWQRGMPQGSAMVMYKGATSAVFSGDTLASGGITVLDPYMTNVYPTLGTPVVTTATSNATQPVVSTASTAGLVVGSIVRLTSPGQQDISGVDMVVSAVTANTSFTLLTATNALANVPGAAGTAGTYTIVSFDPLYYPRRRFITNITLAVNAQVSTSVPHQYVVGQAVRFNIPNVSGMTQLNPTPLNNYLYATIVSVVDLYNFTINVNTSSFNPFTFPTAAQSPSSLPEVTPIGENTAFALTATASQTPTDQYGNVINAVNSGILSDSTVNTAYLGVILGSGGVGTALTTPIIGPAGSGISTAGVITAPDVLYWVAGKSTYGGL